MGNGAGIGPAFGVSFIVRAITSSEVRSPAELATMDTMLMKTKLTSHSKYLRKLYIASISAAMLTVQVRHASAQTEQDTLPRSGLVAQAAIGGPRFSYKPRERFPVVRQ